MEKNAHISGGKRGFIRVEEAEEHVNFGEQHDSRAFSDILLNLKQLRLGTVTSRC